MMETVDLTGGDTSLSHTEPMCIIELPTSIKPETKDWLLQLIQCSPTEGGAGLDVWTTKDNDYHLYVAAQHERLLEGAESMSLRKKCKDGSIRDFELSVKKQFDYESANFLTSSERQRVVHYYLMHIRGQERGQIPGTDIALYTEQRIIPRCLSQNIIEEVYPLHEKEELDKLVIAWYSNLGSFVSQPIEGIRNYFGEAIAIYFSFLGFYTMGLVLPASIGLLYFLVDSFVYSLGYMYAFFAIFNLVWTTVFLEMWKRKCNAMSFNWGTYGTVKFEDPRPEFVGRITVNPVTGRREPTYPKSERQLKMFGVSWPVVFVFLVIAFFMMLASFWCEDWLKTQIDVASFVGQALMMVPSSVYAVAIILMNSIYRKIAAHLNDWENHRLQSEYENNLVLKLVVFDFANCFMSLFYIAFYLQDMGKLKKYLGTLLIVQQFIEQFLETALPYLVLRFWRGHTELNGDAAATAAAKKNDEENANCDALDSSFRLMAEEQGKMDIYPGTFDDYLELFLQFGYVFLFSAVYPLAAVFALLNNVIEVKSDAFKLTKVCRRPFGQAVADIGSWQVTFEIMGVIAVLTNVALLAMSPEVQALVAHLSTAKFILLFVAVEWYVRNYAEQLAYCRSNRVLNNSAPHVFLALKAAIAILIPDLPDWMEEELAKEEYQSRHALNQKKAAELEKSLSEEKKDR